MDVACGQIQSLTRCQHDVVHQQRDHDTGVTRVKLVESRSQLESSTEIRQSAELGVEPREVAPVGAVAKNLHGQRTQTTLLKRIQPAARN